MSTSSLGGNYMYYDLKSIKELMYEVYKVENPSDEVVNRFIETLNTLSEKEVAVVSLKYGLVVPGNMSDSTVAEFFHISETRVRLYRVRAFKRLKHPVRMKYIFGE